MLTLGLHFGHDASMSLVEATASHTSVLDFAEKERETRVKHALSLSASDIAAFLMSNGLASIGDVDTVYLTSTQQVPIIDFEGRLSLAALPENGGLQVPSSVAPGGSYLRDVLPLDHHYRKHLRWHQGPVGGSEYLFHEEAMAFPAAHFQSANPWEALGNMKVASVPAHSRRQELVFSLDGVAARRACFVPHHLAHASYAARSSPFGCAVVISFDGQSSVNFDGGGIYLYLRGEAGERLVPVAPHGFWCGAFYDHVGMSLGFEGDGAAGKLMGLSSYGLPVYDDAGLVGPQRGAGPGLQFEFGWTLAKRWLERCTTGRRSRDSAAWDGWSRPPEWQADIACSAQRIFERNVVKLASSALAMAEGMGVPVEGVVLSGGCALNCPANSLVARMAPTYVPPAINDEGLSLGAAALDAKCRFDYAGTPRSAYLGRDRSLSEAILKAKAQALHLDCAPDGDLSATAALLMQGQIGALFHGRAEVGPRALGHRSIVASPLIAEIHARVNRLKNREPWRPLAPMATAEACAAHFSHIPPASWFMLFTGRCLTPALPAITHVDGSARVQIVSPDSGPAHALLRRFGALSGFEVLLNTSFNGRGEPIVETAEDAFRSFLALGLDFLWIDGQLVRASRRQAGA